MYYLGIDLGTSSTKFLLVDDKGNIIKELTKEYDLIFPHPGWSEQRPEDWWKACTEGIPEMLKDVDASQIAGIGCGGQMHGLVALDENNEVIRPAILWNDGRTGDETDYLNEVIGRDKLTEYTQNIAFPGFTAPKILWMKKNEPEKFSHIRKIMLPKDYINFRLTGVYATDYSDASGMLLLDVKNKKWSEEMLEICGISEDMLPALYESYDVIGKVTKEAADLFGLAEGTIVVAGAGDNAGAAIGTGTVENGDCNISLGTSGTIFISTDKSVTDKSNALHSFAHSNGKFHLMGCMLSAASCNKWICESILHTEDIGKELSCIDDSMLGNNDVYFLPYLMGERSPINDVHARATFTGMTMDTERKDMLLAVLEGVAFALRDSFEAVKKSGIEISESYICGGGAKNETWVKIISNVLGISIKTMKTEMGPGYGAAILAMAGAKVISSVEEAKTRFVETDKTYLPDAELKKKYDMKYSRFKEIYPALKDVFSKF